MVQTAWGGSEIDDWTKNSSIAACKNAEGLPEPNRQGPGRGGDGGVYPNNGALWNGTYYVLRAAITRNTLRPSRGL
jgi:hypothetical protein